MSDVIFESEREAMREEKRKSLKRVLIPVGIFLLLVIIVVAVALIIKNTRKTVYKGGENTPYPYSWYVEKDGSVKLSIDHSASPGHSWSFKESDNSALMSIEIDEKQKKKDLTSFTIKPLEPGRALQTFELKPDEEGSAAIYELMLFSEVIQQEEGFKTEFIGTSLKPVEAPEKGGDEVFTYSLAEENGMLIVTVLYDVEKAAGDVNILPGNEATPYDLNWNCTAAGSRISIEGIIYSRGRVKVRLAAGSSAGTDTAVLRNEDLGVEVDITVSVGENGEIKAEAHELKRFEATR